MKSPFYLAVCLAVSLSVSGCVDRQAQKQAQETMKEVSNPIQTVGVQPASIQTLTRSLEITGQVTTSADTEVGAKATGRIIGVYVKDGDFVKAGQVVAMQDTTPLQAALNQAQAGVLTARAALAQAESQLTQALRNADINPDKSTATVISAQASLRAAQANLAKMIAGARPQERIQAQATLNSAKANLDVQKKQLDRIRTLVQQGALAGSQLDQQEATYESALATYQNADQALSLVQQGNRKEDIDAAKEQVAEAKQALKTAQASKNLDPLWKDQVDASRANVTSAKAGIENAQAQVVIARQNLADAAIRAPFSGQVSGKPVEAGTIAGPGTTIIHIVGSQGIYFEGSVTSDDIGEIRSGLPVHVKVSAVSDKDFPAKVAAISPLASSVGRLFTVRVQFIGAPPEVKPGMFATGEVVVQTVPNATVIPASAVISRGDTHFVFVADNGKAKKTEVSLGLQQGQLQQVMGLPSGAQVVVQGQDHISDGAQITVQKPVGLAASTGKGTFRGEG